jgi:flagellar hook-basal body complex protein FliE
MASPTVAANAYANLARVLESGGSSKGNANLARIMETGGVTAGADGAGPSFSAVLKDAIGGVLEAGRKSDAKTVAMANGKANVMDVVTAVAETDVAVSTMVSVRDKVIQAYEDIMKMTI